MFTGNINFGQYIPTGSVVHKLDPRAKLFALIITVSSIFPAKNFLQIFTWCAMLFILVKISKISWAVMIKTAKPVFFLVAFTFIFNIIAVYFGKDWEDALFHAFFTSIRLIVLMMFAIILPLTTAPLELADGIDTLLGPLDSIGFPAHEFAMMMGLALRFIPLLVHETDKIIRAQVSRGAMLDQGNIFQRVKAFFPVLIPLFIIIFRRADEIASAMEARGYEGGKGRTRRKPLIWKISDTLFLITSIFVALTIYFAF